jgi:hypothetical protein
MYGNPFPTAQDFIIAANMAPRVKITRAIDNQVSYRSGVSASKEQLINALKTYQSWPMYRNEKTVDALYDWFAKNKPMEMPIILKQGSRMRIFSGNTRADVVFQLGLPYYMAIVIEV